MKHIAGQAAYQLAVMYGLIFYAPALLGIPGEPRWLGGRGGGQVAGWQEGKVGGCTHVRAAAGMPAPARGSSPLRALGRLAGLAVLLPTPPTSTPPHSQAPALARAPCLPAPADHAAVVGPSEHYTLVFNTFVFMQARKV